MTTRQLSSLDQRMLRDAFGAFPSGVVAVAASVKGHLAGLAASSFTSISIDPPLVSFSVATSSSSWPLLREAGHLGVSVLADHHDDICRQLAGPREQRFDGLSFHVTDGGAVLLKEAVATFDVTVRDVIEAGDHVIVLLRIHEVGAGDGEHPLVFHRSGFAKLHRADLDPTRLDGRINGADVHASGLDNDGADDGGDGEADLEAAKGEVDAA
jgi:flavin reductase (DIM6/NTAB) family NADH-FMN oxidoreductase RutF